MMNEQVAGLDRLMRDQPDTLPEMLELTRESVIELLTRISPAPRRLRLSVGPVDVELDWSAPASAPVNGASPPTAAALPVAVTPAPAPDLVDHVHAPIVGVFYVSPEPGAKPFVSVGDIVVPGQQIGIVEAMKLMVPVEADRHCRIMEFLHPNGTPVEFGDPLFAVEPVDGGARR